MTTTSLPWRRPLTADQFFYLQDHGEGGRPELIDGVVVVSPSPYVPHQTAAFRIAVLLDAACPPRLQVHMAPLDVRLSSSTVAEPDVLVTRREDATGDRLTGVPLLAVEVLSDSTRSTDLLLKRGWYERAGIASYWLVDPVSLEIKVLELGPDGTYAEVVHADLATPLTIDRPFTVTLQLTR